MSSGHADQVVAYHLQAYIGAGKGADASEVSDTSGLRIYSYGSLVILVSDME